MKHNPNSPENDPVYLYRAARDYPEFPHGLERQKRFLKDLMIFRLNGSGTVDEAPAHVVASAAYDKWIKAQQFVSELTDEQYEHLKYKAEGKPLPKGHPLELSDILEGEEPHFDVPGCMN